MKRPAKETDPATRKNHEVEMKAIVNDSLVSRLEQRIMAEGAELVSEVYIVDIYLCPKSIGSFSEIEMHDVGSYSLRLRKQRTGTTTTIELNSKMITTEGDHQAWEEHETEVISFEETLAILQTIGFRPFFTLEKIRTTYSYDNLNICIDNITDFGLVVEVEVITTQAESQKAKNEIRDFFSKFGIEKDQIVTKSVTNQLMREQSLF